MPEKAPGQQKMDPKSHKILVRGSVDKKELNRTDADKKIARSLHYSNIDGVLTSASSSILASFITPFALFLKANAVQIGILTAVENLGHTVAQIPGAKATEYANRKFIWTFARIVSRLVFFVPLIMLPFLGMQDPVTWLIIISAFIFFFIGFATPAWSSMMGDLVPADIRGRYFGRRNMYIGIAGIVATIAAGFLVTFFGFPFIFLIASVLGLLSIPFFLKMYEPPIPKVFHYSHSFALRPSHWLPAMRANRGLVIFTIYLMLMSFAINIAAPFYTVYMLKDLSIDYATFAVIVTLGALARILSYGYWGKFNDLFGSRTIFIICASLGITIPFFWLLVTEATGAAIATIIDGLIFSGFDLVAFDYLLDVTPAEKRPQFIANHNFFVGMGVVFGSLAGGFLATSLEGFSSVLNGLQMIFLISLVLRILFLPILKVIPEIRVEQSKIAPVSYVFWKAVAVEPLKGLQHTIAYSFRYPEHFKRHIDGEVKKLKFKVNMTKS